MVEILIKHSDKVESNRREGGLPLSFRASPAIVDHPDDLPQNIHVRGFYIKETRASKYEEAVEDTGLTNLFQQVTGNAFPVVKVQYLHTTQGNIPIINCSDHYRQAAIGARTTMLHNQYGIGPLIMHLLDMSPLWIMAPDEVEQEFMNYYYCQDDDRYNRYWERIYDSNEGKPFRTGVYPDWCFEKCSKIPNGLPPRLSQIIQRCTDASHGSTMASLPTGDDTIDPFPFLFCCWYGWSEPWVDRRLERMVLNNHDYMIPPQDRVDILKKSPGDQGQGDDLTWIVLDNLYKRNENTCDQTCMPECHDMDEAEDIIRRFGPFVDLIKYISHELR